MNPTKKATQKQEDRLSFRFGRLANATVWIESAENVNHQRIAAFSMIHQLQRRRQKESKANRDAYNLKT
jgi:hypothetical protein